MCRHDRFRELGIRVAGEHSHALKSHAAPVARGATRAPARTQACTAAAEYGWGGRGSNLTNAGIKIRCLTIAAEHAHRNREQRYL